MGLAVPQDDLPSNVVPESDLPDFQETPGGAVTGLRMQRAGQLGTGRGFSEIGGATLLGAGAGAVAPELLTGAAGALRQFPQGARVAPFLESAAIAAKAAGRPTTAIFGGISGLSGETAGQMSESMGAGPVTAETVRFVAGGVAPETAVLARKVLGVWQKIPKFGFFEQGKKEIVKQLMYKLEGRQQDLDEKEAAFLNSLIDDLRGAPKSTDALSEINMILQRGAQKRLAVAGQEAERILSETQKAVNRDVMAPLSTSLSQSRAGVDRLRARGQDALATAQMQRLNIGDDVDVSDIGNVLRQRIVGRNQAAIAQRRSQFEADELARDSIVSNKESGGEFINSLPEYDSLVRDLQSSMKPGFRSPDVQKTYERILSSVKNPEKDVFGQNKPISFQAIDDVRRNLGRVFEGAPPEGYEAISASDARKYYVLISNLQKKFAGEPQERLLQRYAESSEGMKMFGSRLGKKATAIDKYDDARFQTDAASLPRQYFNTKQGVQDLIELSGDRTVVLKAARDFITNELRDLDSKGVQAWMTKRRELLTALPEIRNDVVKYNNILSRGEDIAKRAEIGVRKHSQFQGDIESRAQRESGDLTRSGERKAAEVRSLAERESSVLMGREYPVERVRTLIESGDPRQWQLAAPEIMASSGGQQKIIDSVRQVMADRASKSTVGLTDFYSRNVRPALEATGAIPKNEVQAIATKLETIQNMRLPEPQKLGLMRRVILQSFAGYAASGAARGTSSLVNLIPQ